MTESSSAVCPSCSEPVSSGAEACFNCGHEFRARTITRGAVLSGRYEIRKLLGQGGMGSVYSAFDRTLDEEVALKVLRPDLARAAEAGHRFRGEIKIARKVRHPGVCAIHEYGEDQGHRYIVMELLQGVDLRGLLRQKGGFAWSEAVSLAAEIADALHALHATGVIHRDLKSSNVMLDERGRARLMDFGIAKQLDTAGMTATGQVVGTPEYMSPEQIRGHAVSFASDLYALGIVLFELLTGRLPFRAETPVAVVVKQLQEQPPLDGPGAPVAPAEVVDLLRRLLAKDPAERPADAAVVAAELRSYLPPGTAPARAARGPDPIPAAHTPAPGSGPIVPIIPIAPLGTAAPHLPMTEDALSTPEAVRALPSPGTPAKRPQAQAGTTPPRADLRVSNRGNEPAIELDGLGAEEADGRPSPNAPASVGSIPPAPVAAPPTPHTPGPPPIRSLERASSAVLAPLPNAPPQAAAAATRAAPLMALSAAAAIGLAAWLATPRASESPASTIAQGPTPTQPAADAAPNSLAGVRPEVKVEDAHAVAPAATPAASPPRALASPSTPASPTPAPSPAATPLPQATLTPAVVALAATTPSTPPSTLMAKSPSGGAGQSVQPANAPAGAASSPVTGDTAAIEHTPVQCLLAEEFPQLQARISAPIVRMRAYFRSVVSAEWYYVEGSGKTPTYMIVLPRPTLAASPITYYFQASLPNFREVRTAAIEAIVVKTAAACPGTVATVGKAPAGGVTVFSAAGAVGGLFSRRPPTIEESVGKDLSSKNAETRLLAVNAAAGLGVSFAVRLGSLAARDSDTRVREAALKSLRALGEPGVDALAKAVADPKKSSTRVDAARALGLLRAIGPSGVRALTAAASSRDSDLAKAASLALDEVSRQP